MTHSNVMQTSLESNIFLIEALIETLNNDWKVSALENGHVHSYKLGYDVAKRFIKVWRYDLFNGEVRDGRSIYFFIDKNDGAVYKPASYKAPAKGIRFYINQLADNPAICDPYGSFLYRR